MGAEKKQIHGKEIRLAVSRGRGQMSRVKVTERDKLPVIRQLSSGDIIDSMVTIVDNTVLYTSKLLRE